MARDSVVGLSHVNIPGNHTFAFANNAARDSWFDSKDKVVYSDLSHVRKEGIQVPAQLEEIKNRNIGYYVNDSGARVYFRITNMRYISDENTLLEIETDVLLTYLPSCTMYDSFIERSNEVPSSMFDSDVPEVVYHGGFTNTLLYQFGGIYEWLFFVQLAGGSGAEDTDLYQTEVNLKNFVNDEFTISFPSKFMFFADEDDFQLFVQDYATEGTGDRILAAGLVPYTDLNFSEVGGGGIQTGIITVDRSTATISVSSALNNRIAKDNVTVVISEIDNFANQIEIPISELSTGSIQLVSVSDPVTQQRHIAVLSGVDGDNELKYRITINTGASLPSLNLPYYMAMRNIETDLGAQQQNNVMSGVSSFITSAGSGAIGGAIAGSAVGGAGALPGAVVGGIVGGIGSVMSTATNALNNETSAKAALEKASRQAPTVSGVAAGLSVLANRKIGVNVFLKEPSGSGLSQLQDYYRFFGYNKSRIQTPNVKSGTKFYKGNVNGNFIGASPAETSVIRELFTSGVWIWTNEASEFDY